MLCYATLLKYPHPPPPGDEPTNPHNVVEEIFDLVKARRAGAPGAEASGAEASGVEVSGAAASGAGGAPRVAPGAAAEAPGAAEVLEAAGADNRTPRSAGATTAHDRLTLAELRACGAGGTVVSMLVDVQGFWARGLGGGRAAPEPHVAARPGVVEWTGGLHQNKPLNQTPAPKQAWDNRESLVEYRDDDRYEEEARLTDSAITNVFGAAARSLPAAGVRQRRMGEDVADWCRIA